MGADEYDARWLAAGEWTASSPHGSTTSPEALVLDITASIRCDDQHHAHGPRSRQLLPPYPRLTSMKEAERNRDPLPSNIKEAAAAQKDTALYIPYASRPAPSPMEHAQEPAAISADWNWRSALGFMEHPTQTPEFGVWTYSVIATSVDR